jgi:CRISPR/Cas system Type II protein with McrA/HNH and RuvC-like nuclease domain
MRQRLILSRTDRPLSWWSAERISKLLGDAELKDKMASTTSSKNWLTLVRILAKLITENTDLKIELRELKHEYINHDLHLAALNAKVDRALKRLEVMEPDE